jgi:antitoxin (DNA-binding transcriptional repressor) of toxin-antitoxin stability system
MQILTVTQARAQLGRWMKRAAGGADIGIIVGGQVVALRPVPVVAADYAWTEYGLTPDEMDRIAKKIHAETKKERAAGHHVPLEDYLARTAPRRARGSRHRGAGKAAA